MRHFYTLLLLVLLPLAAWGDDLQTNTITFTPSALGITSANKTILERKDYYGLDAWNNVTELVSLRFRDQGGGLVSKAWEYDSTNDAFKSRGSEGRQPQLRLYGKAGADVDITKVEITFITNYQRTITVVAKESDTSTAEAALTTTSDATALTETVEITSHKTDATDPHCHSYVTLTNLAGNNAHITQVKVTCTSKHAMSFHPADVTGTTSVAVPYAMTLKPGGVDVTSVLDNAAYSVSGTKIKKNAELTLVYSDPRQTNASVADVAITNNGRTVTVTPLAVGETELRLTTTDPYWAPATAILRISVAEAPLTVHFKNQTFSDTQQKKFVMIDCFDAPVAVTNYLDYAECDGQHYTITGFTVLPTTTALFNHPEVAYVNQQGQIVGAKKGMADITLSCTVEGFTQPVETILPVMVKKAHPITIAFNTLLESYTLETGKTLSAKMIAKDKHGNIVTSSDIHYTYSSSNTAVATVAADGTVSPVSPGEATITVTATANYTDANNSQNNFYSDYYWLGDHDNLYGGTDTKTVTKKVIVKNAATTFAEIRFKDKQPDRVAGVGDQFDLRDLITVEGRVGAATTDADGKDNSDWRTLTRYADLPLHIATTATGESGNDYLAISTTANGTGGNDCTITVTKADGKKHQVWVTIDDPTSAYPIAGHENNVANGKGTFALSIKLESPTPQIQGPKEVYVRRGAPVDLSQVFSGILRRPRGQVETPALSFAVSSSSHITIENTTATASSDDNDSPATLTVTMPKQTTWGMTKDYTFTAKIHALGTLPRTTIREGAFSIDSGTQTYALTLGYDSHALPAGYTPTAFYYTTDGTDPRTSSTRTQANDISAANTADISVSLPQDAGVEFVNAVIAFTNNGQTYYGEGTSWMIRKDETLLRQFASHTDADGKKVYDELCNNADGSLHETLFQDQETGRALCTVSWGDQYSSKQVHSGTWGTPKRDTGSLTSHRLLGAVDVSLVPGSDGQCDATGELWTNDKGRFYKQFGATVNASGATATFTPYTTEAHSTFDIPTKGSYFKIEPESDGFMTIVARMNGCFDTSDKPSSSKTRRRYVYVCDEHGAIMPIVGSTVDNQTVTKQTGVEAMYHTGMPVTDRDADSKANFWNITSANIGSSGSEDAKRATANMQYYRQALGINNATWNAITGDNLPADGQTAGNTDPTTYYNKVIGDPNVNGYCTINTAYVAFRWPVKAGKTYFLMGNLTKIGAAGMMFEPSATYQPQELAVPDADFSAKELTGSSGYRFQKDHAYNVLLERKFEKGKWAAMVLPFSLSRRELRATFGDQVSVLYLRDVDRDRVLRFIHHYHQMIPAGTPVFLRPSAFPKADGDPQTVAAVRFDNVTWELPTAQPAAPTPFIGNDDEGNYIFHTLDATETDLADWQICGTYVPTTMPAGSWYVSGGAITVTETGDKPIKSTRCWLQKGANGTPGAKLASRPMTFVSADELSDEMIALEIHGITDTTPAATAAASGIYNLAGQKVNTAALTPGLYIVNGKKTIIR